MWRSPLRSTTPLFLVTQQHVGIETLWHFSKCTIKVVNDNEYNALIFSKLIK